MLTLAYTTCTEFFNNKLRGNLMKKYVFIAIILLLFSCKSEDEPTKYTYHNTQCWACDYDLFHINTGEKLGIRFVDNEYFKRSTNLYDEMIDENFKSYFVYKEFPDLDHLVFYIACYKTGSQYDVYYFLNKNDKRYIGSFKETDKGQLVKDEIILNGSGLKVIFKENLGIIHLSDDFNIYRRLM